jgi:hypothetical protein
LKVNGETVVSNVRKGWVALHRRWVAGDSIALSLSMTVERVTMPLEFKDYRNLAALRRRKQADLSRRGKRPGPFNPLSSLTVRKGRLFDALATPQGRRLQGWRPAN